MHARSSSEIASPQEARALLGLDGPVETEALNAAFRRAIKAARPDGPDGDHDRFRRVIAAWRLLQAQAPSTAPCAAPECAPTLPVIQISPLEALSGARVEVALGERRVKARAPAGTRTGDRVRLRRAADDGGDLYLTVLIRREARMHVMGDDLYMTVDVSPRLLEDGGRLEIPTHAGPRSAWIVAGQSSLQLRMRDLGLPPRGSRPQGHLFVTLSPSQTAPSAAEDMLTRFTRVWTPDRMAA